MNLNINQIKHLADSGKLFLTDVIRLLQDRNAIKKVNDENIGTYFGSQNDVCEILDNNTDPQVLKNTINEQIEDASFIINLAYFLPTSFSLNIHCLFEHVIKFNYDRLCIILSRKKNLFSIIEYIVNIDEKNEMVFSQKFIILILLAAKRYAYFQKDRNELSFLLKITYFVDSKDMDLIKTFLLPRLSSISVDKQRHYKKSIKKRIALMVNGQFRSLKNEHLEKYKVFLNDFDVDVFVSTWINRGGANIKLSQRSQLYRFFKNDAALYLSTLDQENFKLVADKCIALQKTDLKDVTYEEVNTQLQWANNVNINIKDEANFPFINMSNQEKMYFHNNYWFEELGNKYFSQYDYIFKTRPDIDIISIDMNAIMEDLTNLNFITEETGGWIFRNWGFGVGDQILIGQPKVMIDLMTIYQKSKYDYITSEALGIAKFRGHINIGIEAFLNDYECLVNKYFKIKFVEISKIDICAIKNIMSNP